MADIAVTNEREIQPMQLSLEQLSSLKTQHENEIQKSRYNNAKAVLGDISTCPSGNSLMIPLNSSLYVPGKIINPEKVCAQLAALSTIFFIVKLNPFISVSVLYLR